MLSKTFNFQLMLPIIQYTLKTQESNPTTPTKTEILKLLPKGSEIIDITTPDLDILYKSNIQSILFHYATLCTGITWTSDGWSIGLPTVDDTNRDAWDKCVMLTDTFEEQGLLDVLYLYGEEFYTEWDKQIKENPDKEPHDLFDQLAKKLLEGITQEDIWNSKIQVTFENDDKEDSNIICIDNVSRSVDYMFIYDMYPFRKKLHV